MQKTVSVHPDTHKTLKMMSAEQGKTITEVVTMLLNFYTHNVKRETNDDRRK